MSANCCTKTLDLGCWNCCQTFIELPVTYPSTGAFKVWFKYAGRNIFRAIAGVEGEPIIIAVSGLNEDFTFYGYITDPDNEVVTLTVNDVVYDCFSFRFHEGVELQPEPGTCSPATVSINGVQVATPASGATAAIEVVDQDGNPIGSLVSGQWVVTISEGVEYIVQTYADEATALADTTTVVAAGRAIVVAGRLYQGTGSNASALVAAKVFNPSFTETTKGINTTVVSENVGVALTDPT